MKKITILTVAALAISVASCKKDRTCTCTSSVVSKTSTQPGYSYTPGPASTSKTTYTKIKKSNTLAEQCVTSTTTDDYTYTVGSSSYVMTEVDKNDCTLK
jgi:hypothetical protein